ncbi:MAG: sigma-70 family RNA polymerase sigma factor [Tepidisphaera sp.]|nr:sigma-70 family RNA polymerase sigma factor [Tepidisphaera sp.]
MTLAHATNARNIMAAREQGVPEGSRKSRFEIAVMQHLDAAHNLAWWMTRNDHDAADAVQDACLKAWRFFDDLRAADAKAWFLAIVRTTVVDRLRARKQYVELSEAAAIGNTPPASGTSDVSRVHEVLAGLPHPWREVLVLREVEGLTYQQISVVLGVPAGTVMSRLSRARDAAHAALTAAQEKKP